ncbi:MAG: glycosyltransferase family 9 protein [Bacteroidia bacterium]
MKILIVRFSSIGDIVLTTPVVRCLKKQLPDAEIHFLTKPEYGTILENNPYIDQLHLLDQPLLKKSLELRQVGFDVVIDLHNNLRTRILKTIIGVSSYSFEKLNFEKWVMVNFKIDLLPKIHIVDRYMETIAPLGVKNDDEGLDYFVNEKTLSPDLKTHNYASPLWNRIDSIPKDEYLVFAIGGNHFTKKLPNEKIISICKLINEKIVLLGGKEDEANGDTIAKACGENVTNLCGKLSINESAFMIKHSEKVITHDTGLMHIASAFKKEIISIWGNTIPEFGMQPYYGRHKTQNFKLETLNLKCRPCSKIGFDNCPKGHFNCMMLQDVNKIAEVAF